MKRETLPMGKIHWTNLELNENVELKRQKILKHDTLIHKKPIRLRPQKQKKTTNRSSSINTLTSKTARFSTPTRGCKVRAQAAYDDDASWMICVRRKRNFEHVSVWQIFSIWWMSTTKLHKSPVLRHTDGMEKLRRNGICSPNLQSGAGLGRESRHGEGRLHGVTRVPFMSYGVHTLRSKTKETPKPSDFRPKVFTLGCVIKLWRNQAHHFRTVSCCSQTQENILRNWENQCLSSCLILSPKVKSTLKGCFGPQVFWI